MRKLATREENKNRWTMEATCDGNGWDQERKTPCLQLFELDAADIRYRKHTDYGGGTDIYYGFVCPECGCFTEIPSSKIPSNVRSKAREY